MADNMATSVRGTSTWKWLLVNYCLWTKPHSPGTGFLVLLFFLVEKRAKSWEPVCSSKEMKMTKRPSQTGKSKSFDLVTYWWSGCVMERAKVDCNSGSKIKINNDKRTSSSSALSGWQVGQNLFRFLIDCVCALVVGLHTGREYGHVLVWLLYTQSPYGDCTRPAKCSRVCITS